MDINIDAIILCGGFGTRLKDEVPDLPKALALVRGRPFLDILIAQLTSQGIRRIIFGVGHLSDKIVSYYRNRNDGVFVFSMEESPLGTGGAVKHALQFVRTDPFLVLNGDSHCNVDFGHMSGYHSRANADMTMAVTRPDDRKDAGAIELGADGRILGFHEKDECIGGFVNAGVYLMTKRIFTSAPSTFPLSLEYEFFPELVQHGKCYGFPIDGELVDIGTPDRLRGAQTKLL